MTRTESRERTRNEIVRAGLEVFAKKGYRGASVGDIAGKVKMTKGALYWHFKNKLDLHNAVSNYVLKEYERVVLEPLSGIADPQQRLRQMITMALRFYRENPEIGSFYLAMIFEGSLPLQSKMLRITAQIYRHYRDMIGRIVSDGIRLKEFIGIDPKGAALIIVAVLDGVVMQWMLDKGHVDLNQAETLAQRMLLEGLHSKRSTVAH
jgi:TetR/AcrR family acrAB operon transcriptional repressor